MNIYDIPIAEITKKYLEYLAEMKKFDLDIAGDFLVMAATLVYIKSRMLLPQEKDEEEDESGGDPRAELVRKLLEYQAFKEAAKELGIMEDEQGKVFTRQVTDYYLADLDAEDVEIDNFSANLYDLLSAFQVVLAKAGRKDMHEIYEEQVSIEERVRDIQIMLTQKKTILFSELFPETWTRNYLIATFLALLEIVRTKYAKVRQKEKYGEITLEKR
ncbi:MAG: segregation/condensation protein A [Candidatus Omnitrophica bacterium]|nr:segregation/condensation protein A [Candidatus Omnitrophota bacterium]